MDFGFLAESPFLIKMGIVAVVVIIAGVVISMRMPASGKSPTDEEP